MMKTEHSEEKKVAHTRLQCVGFRSWSRFLAVSLQVAWVINPAVGCHYFPTGLQLPPQPLRGLLPVSLLGERRHDGCEQFAYDCYPTASRLRFEPGPFCAWVQHANQSATEPPYGAISRVNFGLYVPVNAKSRNGKWRTPPLLLGASNKLVFSLDCDSACVGSRLMSAGRVQSWTNYSKPRTHRALHNKRHRLPTRYRTNSNRVLLRPSLLTSAAGKDTFFIYSSVFSSLFLDFYAPHLLVYILYT